MQYKYSYIIFLMMIISLFLTINAENEDEDTSLFDAVDANGDNELDFKELYDWLQSLGVQNIEEVIGYISSKYGSKNDQGNVNIDPEEFNYVIEEFYQTNNTEIIHNLNEFVSQSKKKTLFEQIDTNNDGVIDEDEIEKTLESLGAQDAGEAARLLMMNDNNDGQPGLSPEEFENSSFKRLYCRRSKNC